ncbi:hypothetical protein V8C86DRAFT_2526120 [Haematococcus lacustris]
MRSQVRGIMQQVAAGGLSVWAVECAERQVSRLAAEVAILGQLQAMMAQLGGVTDCLELLGRQHQEQAQRIAVIQEQRAGEVQGLTQDVHILQQRCQTLSLNQQNMGSDNEIMLDRLRAVEQRCVALLALSADVTETRELLERHLRQPPVNFMLPAAAAAAASRTSLSERLDYDNPAVRRSTAQALRVARSGGAMSLVASPSQSLPMVAAGPAGAAPQHFAGPGVAQGTAQSQGSEPGGMFSSHSATHSSVTSSASAPAWQLSTAGTTALPCALPYSYSKLPPRPEARGPHAVLQRQSVDSGRLPGRNSVT